MQLLNITQRSPELLNTLQELWEGSVRATHHFLSEQDIVDLRPLVRQGLKHIPTLIVAFSTKNTAGAAFELNDEQNRQNRQSQSSELIKHGEQEKLALGFMGLAEDKIEMLFIRQAMRGQGIGKTLINYALAELKASKVDVNEQNTMAYGFYKHVGFTVFERSELDDQGREFPILHMKKAD